MTVPMQPAKAALAHFYLDGNEINSIQIKRRVEYRHAVIVGAENVVGHKYMKVDVVVELAAEPVHDGHGSEPDVGRCVRTAPADGRLHRPQEHPEQPAVDHVGPRLDHPASGARWADTPALAGERDKEFTITLSRWMEWK